MGAIAIVITTISDTKDWPNEPIDGLRSTCIRY